MSAAPKTKIYFETGENAAVAARHAVFELLVMHIFIQLLICRSHPFTYDILRYTPFQPGQPSSLQTSESSMATAEETPKSVVSANCETGKKQEQHGGNTRRNIKLSLIHI